jgi:hypothetical protein
VALHREKLQWHANIGRSQEAFGVCHRVIIGTVGVAFQPRFAGVLTTRIAAGKPLPHNSKSGVLYFIIVNIEIFRYKLGIN